MAKQSEQFDIVLANGRVIDPETYLDGIYNVGINGGQIATITKDQPGRQGGPRCIEPDRLAGLHRPARPRPEHPQQSDTELRWGDHGA